MDDCTFFANLRDLGAGRQCPVNARKRMLRWCCPYFIVLIKI